MLYLAYAFNTLVIVALVFELHQARKERQSLSLLIKSRDVAEFVRAERRLAAPAPAEDAPTQTSIELEDADPQVVLDSLTTKTDAGDGS